MDVRIVKYTSLSEYFFTLLVSLLKKDNEILINYRKFFTFIYLTLNSPEYLQKQTRHWFRMLQIINFDKK